MAKVGRTLTRSKTAASQHGGDCLLMQDPDSGIRCDLTIRAIIYGRSVIRLGNTQKLCRWTDGGVINLTRDRHVVGLGAASQGGLV